MLSLSFASSVFILKFTKEQHSWLKKGQLSSVIVGSEHVGF